MIAKGTIDFDHVGIGKALATSRFTVPVNQREYSWEEEHVNALLQDFTEMVGKGSYFLGTVVLTRSPATGVYEVADGQQRLATTTILLAAIRDSFLRRSEALNVESVENEFLSVIDRDAQDRVPRLKLNVDDHEYFRLRVLKRPDDPDRRKCEPRRESHRRIDAAARLAAEHVRHIVKLYGDRASAELNRWVRFITDDAQVIVLTVPDHLNAFRMFETLNDRGLKTSQADLLKNYLFGEARADRLQEAHALWSGMSWVLESLTVDDVTLTYLRHLLVARHGAIREREVYNAITEEIKGQGPALAFLNELGENAVRYAALLNPTHVHWDDYGNYRTRIPRHVETLIELRVSQIRPLMLACLVRFTPKDIDLAFRMCIWWAVRFMAAGTPTGSVEKHYASRAADIWSGRIPDAEALMREMNKVVPSDDAFRAGFTSLRVPKAYIARYLLRSLEHAKKNDSDEPEWVCNDDPNSLNLEHILPRNPGPGWEYIDPDDADQYHRRLGNMVLLRASTNSKIGNATFAEKKEAYRGSSTLFLTKMVLADQQWGPKEIEARQAELAEIAVRTWPLVPPVKQKRKARGSNPSGA